jgi:hypothetical protein
MKQPRLFRSLELLVDAIFRWQTRMKFDRANRRDPDRVSRTKAWCSNVGTDLPYALGFASALALLLGHAYVAAALFGAAWQSYICWLGYSERMNLAMRLIEEDVSETFALPGPRFFNFFGLIVYLVTAVIGLYTTHHAMWVMTAIGAGIGTFSEYFWEKARKPDKLRLVA